MPLVDDGSPFQKKIEVEVQPFEVWKQQIQKNSNMLPWVLAFGQLVKSKLSADEWF